MQDYATAEEWNVANLPHETHTIFKMRDVRYNTSIPDDTFVVANVENAD